MEILLEHYTEVEGELATHLPNTHELDFLRFASSGSVGGLPF